MQSIEYTDVSNGEIGENTPNEFEQYLYNESVKAYSGEKGTEQPERDAAWYRKQIATRYSKIQRGEGRRETHIARIAQYQYELSKLENQNKK